MNLITWLFETNLQFGSKTIPLREVIGGALGITSAFLGLKRKVAAWPVGIFADAMLFTVFLGAVFAYSENDANFYGQASHNLLLIIVSVYGWVRWAQHRRSGSGNRPAVSPRSRSGIEMGSASCAPLVKWDITEVLNNSA